MDRRLRQFKLILIWLWLLMLGPVCSAQSKHFAVIEGLIDQKIGAELVSRFYQKIGVEISVTPMPGKRAEMEAAAGRKDGEVMRVWEYGLVNPTLIRVPTPFYSVKTMAFVHRQRKVAVASLEDLAGYRLAKVRGVRHTSLVTQGMERVLNVSNGLQLMKALHVGRVDVALTDRLDGFLSSSELGTGTLVAIEQPLASFALYHYVHESQADLVPKIDRVIRSMKASGELQRLIKQVERQVITQTYGEVEGIEEYLPRI